MSASNPETVNPNSNAQDLKGPRQTFVSELKHDSWMKDSTTLLMIIKLNTF